MNIQSFGGTREGAVRTFELQNRVSLPKDYRAFLLEHNGGLLEQMVCFVPGPNQAVLLQVLLGVGCKSDFDLATWNSEYRDEMPADFLVIAIGAGAMLFILGTTGNSEGVYCWDHSHSFNGSSEEFGNTYRVAATFAEFIEGLSPLRLPQ